MKNYPNNTQSTQIISVFTPLQGSGVRNTKLSAHIVAFSRFLRTKGFAISPNRETDALIALSHIEPTKNNFYLALRAVFPQNFKNIVDFDALYDKYWQELEKGVNSKIALAEEESKKKKQEAKSKKAPEPTFQSLKNWLNGNRQEEEELAAYGATTNLEKKDFSSFSDEDLYEVRKLIALMARRLAQKPSRRYEATKRGNLLDFRRVLQKNLRNGEEILHLYFRKPKPERIKLVLLCDVSKSMELYSRFFVQFMYAFRQIYHRIETFVFSTSLHCISKELDENDFRNTLNNLSEKIPAWAGGTDIAGSFAEFSEKFAIKMLDKKSIVIIVSDGLDVGNIEVLEHSMKLMKKRASKIVWLNPLAGNENYKPEAKAMKTAMPYIDIFTSGHNIESLRKMLRDL